MAASFRRRRWPSSALGRARDYLCFARERLVDRTAFGDLQKAPALFVVERSLQLDLALDAVDLALLRLTVLTLLGVDPAVPETHDHPLERPALALDIHAQGHGAAAAEAREQIVIGARAGIIAADARGLVGAQHMAARAHDLGKASRASLGDLDRALGRAAFGLCALGEITARPGDQDLGHIARVLAPAQEMVGIIKRDEALGVPGSGEDGACVLDPDELVAGPVKDQKRAPESRDRLLEALALDVFEELAPDAETAAGELHLGLAVLPDGLFLLAEEMAHMGRIGRRGDGGDRDRLGN